MLEEGRGREAREDLAGSEGFAAECLRARAALLEGDPVAALRWIESARGLAPDAAELWGTEAEILASLDRLEGARESLTEGLARAGATAELERARGVIELRTSGHGLQALQALEHAQALDPDLPFLRWPLGAAHVLVGRTRLTDFPGEALAHARAARALAPASLEARELEAEALAALLDFEGALVLYEELAREGRDVGEQPALLHRRCATRCLLERDREGAIRHYLMARALGLDEEGLGFGAEVLAGESEAALARGIERAGAQDWPAAESEFARALELDPASLAARNHLGLARFQREDFRGAAEIWEELLARAESAGLSLPDPLPLDLARAWRLAGEPGAGRAVLSRYLDRDPDGEWSQPARELLAALEAEALAGK